MVENDGLPVRHVHVDRCVAKAFSEDMKTVAFEFLTKDGEQVLVTVDVPGLTSWRSMAMDAVNDAQRLSLNPGSVPFRRPASFGVASNPNFRGHIFVSFDPETPGEQVFLVNDQSALTMSDQIRNEVYSHMTPEQRARENGKGRLLNSAGVIIPRRS